MTVPSTEASCAAPNSKAAPLEASCAAAEADATDATALLPRLLCRKALDSGRAAGWRCAAGWRGERAGRQVHRSAGGRARAFAAGNACGGSQLAVVRMVRQQKQAPNFTFQTKCKMTTRARAAGSDPGQTCAARDTVHDTRGGAPRSRGPPASTLRLDACCGSARKAQCRHEYLPLAAPSASCGCRSAHAQRLRQPCAPARRLVRSNLRATVGGCAAPPLSRRGKKLPKRSRSAARLITWPRCLASRRRRSR